MKLTETQMIEIAQHAFTRMDGAWFLALGIKKKPSGKNQTPWKY